MNHALTIFPTKLALASFVREPQGAQAALRIDLGARSYPILIGTDILDQASSWDNLPEDAQALIVSNTTVAPLYAARLQQVLADRFRQVLCVELPDGEQHKTWQSLNRIFDALLEHQCDRKTVLFALGGGVVGDITGFAAACYMRGVPFVQVPTTLLAQVDSSVGGKTAINHPLGKNMIGAFYQPRRVVCDMATLATLPEREFSAGLAEIIKYGPIADMEFFDWLEQNMQALRARQHDVMRVAVQRSCEIKAWVVAQDEQEGGMRAILNFGHTFAHAIEAGLGFGTWLHGEAVGCGLVMAVHLSQQLGLVDAAFVNRTRRLVQAAGLPVQAPMLSTDESTNTQAWLQHMRVDKKAEAGQIRFVVLAHPGQAALVSVPDAVVASVITACSQPG
ncbi:MAG: 3-dehydroquinate synthase [Brachymonas sp.]|jgi:3-dehydroquinate synthase|nr:3-dehydroquinate synthase [Brachymonas sp.]MBP9652291.1 3-dehydroquinate synthase [Brachymonas sp.]